MPNVTPWSGVQTAFVVALLALALGVIGVDAYAFTLL